MFKQISEFFENIFLAMLERWKRSADSGEAFGALIADLHKAFDYLNHELLIANVRVR